MTAPFSPAPDTACFHCGQALADDAVRMHWDGAERDFCCRGCAGAAEWIANAGLSDYYQFRQADAVRVDTVHDDLSLWDRPELQAEQVRQDGQGQQITVLTDGMRCAACAWLIDRALHRHPGVLDVNANAVTGRIRITWDQARTRLSAILEDLAQLGYRVHLSPGPAREAARRRERRTAMMRLGVAGLGAIQAMMFAEALYLDTAGEMAIPTRDFLRWVTFMLSGPVVFYAGWPFLAGMWNEVRLRRFGMDTLVATSVLLAYLASLFETVRGGPHVWFDAAVMFVLFLLVARQIEAAARARATDHVDTLARARPAFAWRRGEDGQFVQVPVAALGIGDEVRVEPGEAVPGDGVACHAAAFDESLLSGESVAVPKRSGDEVRAGSIVCDTTAHVRITRTGQDTWLSQLARLIERAQGERPALARLADVVASRFVLGLLLAAALTCIWWLRHEPARAFEVTLAVLVVACPCALSLAIPAALAAAHAALARAGVLALRPDALATLARVDTVVFDKTGTLTSGEPVLQSLQTFAGMSAEQALRMARRLERDSRHPLARVFAAEPAGDVAGEAPEDWDAIEVRQHPGLGLEARIEGRLWRLGQAGFAAAQDDDGAVWLGDGERAWARFVIHDSVRPNAAAAVQSCIALGLRAEVLSGDGQAAVHEVARALGIEQARARQNPEQKLAHIRALQQQGHGVLMVGDGINDAPVLGGADVSMAMHSGTALAHGAADFVLTAQHLERVPQAIVLARRARATVRQNLAWALGYNLLALPFAAAGWVAPWLAALGMAASSLIVTLNALRLARSGQSRDTATSSRTTTQS